MSRLTPTFLFAVVFTVGLFSIIETAAAKTPDWMKQQVEAWMHYDPDGWARVWPRKKVTIDFEPGGHLQEHLQRWQALALSGADVEILNSCLSACTLIVAYVPKERLCFGRFSSLQFHLPINSETRAADLGASSWILKQYPAEIFNWIMDAGGIRMGIHRFLYLPAQGLWAMGYRRCDRDR